MWLWLMTGSLHLGKSRESRPRKEIGQLVRRLLFECFASENSRFGVSCKKTKRQSASQSIVAKGFWCNKWAHTQSLGRTLH